MRGCAVCKENLHSTAASQSEDMLENDRQLPVLETLVPAFHSFFHSATLLEINLALGKPSWHDGPSDQDPAKATDGNFDPVPNHGSCLYTHARYHAWWAVDLEGMYQIHKVVLAPRNYGSTLRLRMNLLH